MRLCALVPLLGYFALNGVFAARTHTPTVDEFAYLPAGYHYLRTGDLTLDSTNPPLLKMAMAAPLIAMDLELDLDPRWRDDRNPGSRGSSAPGSPAGRPRRRCLTSSTWRTTTCAASPTPIAVG